MKNLTNESRYLLYVIRNAVKQQKIDPPSEALNWDDFFALSKKNEIFSLVTTELPTEYLPHDLAQKFDNFTKSEMVRIIAMNNELATVEKLLNEHGVKYMLLKGSVIRNLYPKQLMRQMSDVDILYDVTKRGDVFEIMNSLGYPKPFESGNSDDFHKKPYYTFEFHNRLFKDSYGFCPDFGFVWGRATVSDDKPCCLKISDDDLYLHNIAHMYKHYMIGGFGVRFLIDTYLILKKCSLDFDFINQKIEEMKLTDFESTIRHLSLDLFDSELNENQEELICKILSDGVFGSLDSDNSTRNIEEIYHRFTQDNGRGNLFKYILKRIFISPSRLKAIYPELNSKKYLFLYYYIKRFFDKGIHGAKKIADEAKQIKQIKNKDIEEK